MKAVFYTKNFNKDIKEKVNVILSPEFYWIKKLQMNVPLKEAKKIAKNIFKLNEKDYFFYAFKLDNIIFIIALKKNLNLKIDKKYINSIRIAQIEFYKYKCIDAERCLIKKIDDILFCFIKKNTENCISVDEILKNITLSKYTFNVYNVINIDKKSLFYVFSVLIIFNIVFLIEGISYKNELIKLKKEKLELKKYNIPLNLYQLNSIYETLKNEDKKINKIKKVLEFLSIKLRNFEFKKIDFNRGVFTVVIKTNKNLDNYFKTFNILKSGIKDKNYIIKFKYE